MGVFNFQLQLSHFWTLIFGQENLPLPTIFRPPKIWEGGCIPSPPCCDATEHKS